MCNKITNKIKILLGTIYKTAKRVLKNVYICIKKAIKSICKTCLHFLGLFLTIVAKYCIFLLLLAPIIIEKIKIGDQTILSKIGDNYFMTSGDEEEFVWNDDMYNDIPDLSFFSILWR